MSSISAGTTSGTALVSTADTTGALVLKTNGTTTALTLGADQTATFVGAVTAPSFSGTSSTATNLAGGSAGTVPYQSAINTTQMLAAGSSGQSLLSSGASAPTWGTPALATAATTATTSTNLAGGSNGTIPYQSASGTTQMLAVGTAGQVLQTNGAGAPTWITPSAGAVSLISTATASASSSVSFTGLTTTYAYYFVEYDSLTASSQGPLFTMFVSDNNGSSYKGSGEYKFANFVVSQNSTTTTGCDSTGNSFSVGAVGNGMGTAAGNAYSNGIVYMYSPAATTCNFTWHTMNRNSTTLDTQFGAGGLVTLAAINAIKFEGAGGVTITGNFRLYGVVKT